MNADHVILGAGVVGCSIAWHLARRGVKNVVVLDREAGPGRGTTSRATGGYRAQFGTEINIRLSLLGRSKLLSFKEDTGVDCGYVPAGYIFMAANETQLAELRVGIALQRRCGLDEVREVTPQDIRDLNPAVEIGGLVGGSYCPTDGFIRPLDILRGYFAGARRLGVRFEFDCGDAEPLIERNADGPRVVGVRHRSGTLATRSLINAAGPWAGIVGPRGVGDVPVIPERRQVAITERFDGLPDTMPMTIDCGDGFHLRVRDRRVYLLKPNETAHADPFDDRFDDSWTAGMLESAHARIPVLRNARLDRAACRAGLYEMSPDKHALVGPHPKVGGLFLANGNSGHGVMHSPAIGQALAELLLDGRSRSVDLHALRPSRFLENDPHPIVGVI